MDRQLVFGSLSLVGRSDNCQEDLLLLVYTDKHDNKIRLGRWEHMNTWWQFATYGNTIMNHPVDEKHFMRMVKLGFSILAMDDK